MYGEAYPARGGNGAGSKGGHLIRFLPKWSGDPKGPLVHYNSDAALVATADVRVVKSYGEEIEHSGRSLNPRFFGG